MEIEHADRDTNLNKCEVTYYRTFIIYCTTLWMCFAKTFLKMINGTAMYNTLSSITPTKKYNTLFILI